MDFIIVITSYSIHYTKLYEARKQISDLVIKQYEIALEKSKEISAAEQDEESIEI